MNTPKNPHLNQATQKNNLPKFSLLKKSRNWKFQTQKSPLIIPVTWNPEYPHPPSPPPPNGKSYLPWVRESIVPVYYDGTFFKPWYTTQCTSALSYKILYLWLFATFFPLLSGTLKSTLQTRNSPTISVRFLKSISHFQMALDITNISSEPKTATCYGEEIKWPTLLKSSRPEC